MDERGGLENRCGLCGHRGFESHPLRQKLRAQTRNFVFKPQITQISTEVNAKDAKDTENAKKKPQITQISADFFCVLCGLFSVVFSQSVV